jgi:hypothetical protein
LTTRLSLGNLLATEARSYPSVEECGIWPVSTSAGLKEQEAAEDALPDTALTVSEAAMLVPLISVSARLGIVNGDPDVAADLSEVGSAIGLALRLMPPVVLSTARLRQGLRIGRLGDR